MPEGDTIHRTASTLRTVLAGREVRAFRASRIGAGRSPRPGETVTDVEARGKHLLIHFSGGLTLHTHLGMNGSWHVYRDGERWRIPRPRARVVVEVDGAVAACFSPSRVELKPAADARRSLDDLGPDLCLPEPDLDEVVSRVRLRGPEAEVGVVLLDQRVAAGIGNIYRSEALFAARLHPFIRVGDLSDEVLRRVFETAAVLLRANLGGGPRKTVPQGLAVYGRTRRGCRRCGSRIVSRRQGEQARTVYWCPRCQPAETVTRRSG